MLNFVISKETLELLVNELGSIVSYHKIGYAKVGKDVPAKQLSSLGNRDGG